MSFLQSTAILQGELGLPAQEPTYDKPWWEGPLAQTSQAVADWVQNEMAPGTVTSGYTEPATYPVPATGVKPQTAGIGTGVALVAAGLLAAKLLGVF